MHILDRWADAFAAFLAQFAGLFGRSEPREQMGKYLRGLLAILMRKNSWQLAEVVGDACPDRMQRLSIGRIGMRTPCGMPYAPMSWSS